MNADERPPMTVEQLDAARVALDLILANDGEYDDWKEAAVGLLAELSTGGAQEGGLRVMWVLWWLTKYYRMLGDECDRMAYALDPDMVGYLDRSLLNAALALVDWPLIEAAH